jgi:hypothetical protein
MSADAPVMHAYVKSSGKMDKWSANITDKAAIKPNSVIVDIKSQYEKGVDGAVLVVIK